MCVCACVCAASVRYPDAPPALDIGNANNAWALASVKVELLADLQREAAGQV